MYSTAIKGIIGFCGHRRVFIGFAPASLLHETSFADVLDEDTVKGYQRPINLRHSADFRRYINTPGATTIPLTLNLRSETEAAWRLDERPDGTATLAIDPAAKVFSQVDCQHRLGFLAEDDIPLAFMSFIRLTVEEERLVFTTINSKAKGLSGSLIDTNLASMANSLADEDPRLFIAMALANSKESPWFNLLKKGGKSSLGLKKPVSLRMMKNAAERFLRELGPRKSFSINDAAIAAMHFWHAVAFVYPEAWRDPRRHYVTKGVGVYSLMSVAGLLTREAVERKHEITQAYFINELSDSLQDFDWSNTGTLETFNGEKGADQAFELMRAQIKARKNTLSREIRLGQ